jgi:hypothetical protein
MGDQAVGLHVRFAWRETTVLPNRQQHAICGSALAGVRAWDLLAMVPFADAFGLRSGRQID